jgi:hypothetical protein
LDRVEEAFGDATGHSRRREQGMGRRGVDTADATNQHDDNASGI